MQDRREEIPFIPPLVDIKDVDVNTGRLIKPVEVLQVKLRIAELGNQDGRYSKKQLGTAYSVTKVGDQYYAIYKGEKHEKLLGKGSFGAVKLIQNIDDGSWAVLKTIRKKVDSSDEEHDASVSKETENLKQVGHHLGHFKRRSAKRNIMQDEILMTLAPGMTIANLIKHHDMPAGKWLDLCIGIVESVMQLHERGLLHRDLKPANMMYYPATGTVKQIDVGLARKFNAETREYLGSYAGSPKYMAPEIEHHNKVKRAFNEKTEVFALGITFAEIFKLTRKFHHVEKEIASVQLIRNPVLLDELCALIKKMISQSPNKRPDMHAILKKLKALRDAELDLVSKINSLVYLDVNEYFKLTIEQKEVLFSALKDADEVILCMSINPWASESLMVIRHELEQRGICVAPEALTLSHRNNLEETIQQLKHYTALHGARKNYIYNSFYLRTSAFTGHEEIGSLRRNIDSLEISAEHKSIAMNNINEQIMRISDKNPFDQRLDYLREFRHNLTKGDIKTYRQLFFALEDLERKMMEHQAATLKGRVSNTFGFASTARAALQQASRHIIDDAHGRKSPTKK